jgi:hypothetical protein
MRVNQPVECANSIGLTPSTHTRATIHRDGRFTAIDVSALSLKHRIEAAGEFAIGIAYQETNRIRAVSERPGHLPRLLRFASACRFGWWYPRCLKWSKGGAMSKRLCSTLGLFLLFAVCAVAQTNADRSTIQVEVNYTGSGTVNVGHKIYIALWDSADFNSGPPAAVKSLDSKKGIVTFSDVHSVPAYVTAAYDPTGVWDAQSPPPSGSSLGMYSKNPPTPEPIDVVPGNTVKVSITFDDSAKTP